MTTDRFPGKELLAGQVVLVAGVGGGLGAHLGRGVVAAGGRAVLAARTTEVGDSLVSELGADCALFRRCDVTDDGDCAAVVAAAVERFGRLDGVVLNAMASAGPGATLQAAAVDDWREAFEVNVFGSLRVVKAAVEPLKRSQSASVVFVGSQIVRRVFPGRGPYAASKAALVTAAQVLACELGPEGIRVNTVVPGRMWGDPLRAALPALAAERGREMSEEYEAWVEATALKRLVTDEECSRVALFLLSGLAAGVTGQTLDVNAGETMT